MDALILTSIAYSNEDVRTLLSQGFDSNQKLRLITTLHHVFYLQRIRENKARVTSSFCFTQ